MTRMNMVHTLRRWCLLFAAIATAAFAAPGFAKSYQAVLVDPADSTKTTVSVPNGTGITIKLKVFNTSTEPATINSIVICRPDLPAGATLHITGVVSGTGSGTLLTYIPSGGDANICVSIGNPNGVGWSLSGLTGFKRQTNKTFHLVATVSGPCTDVLNWPIFASTGNVFTSIDRFRSDAPLRVAFGCDAILVCSPPGSYTETSGGNTTTILRLPKPGFLCDPKSFNVLFSNGDNTVEIQWAGLGVVLKTTTDWPPSLVNAQTTQAKTTWVAWAKDGSNNPIYIPEPTCTSDQPPTTNPVTDPFPLINSGVKMPNPDGSYSFVNNPYAGQRAKICAIEEIYSVFSLLPGDPNLPDPPCPAPPPGLDSELVLGCVAKRSILYISDDIFIRNQ